MIGSLLSRFAGWNSSLVLGTRTSGEGRLGLRLSKSMRRAVGRAVGGLGGFGVERGLEKPSTEDSTPSIGPN